MFRRKDQFFEEEITGQMVSPEKRGAKIIEFKDQSTITKTVRAARKDLPEIKDSQYVETMQQYQRIIQQKLEN